MSENLKEIEELYHRALAKTKEERAAFLAEACAGDEALRRELESMLEALEKAGEFMELPALELAARMAGQAGSQLLAGQQLGPYRIGPLLGRGGMGEVYRAVDTRLDRPVALKLLPAEVAGNPERLHRFTREAKAASVLNHPHIATIYEIGEAEGWHFIAMEYVEGETLSERIAVRADPRVRPRPGAHRDAPLPIETILDMSIQVAEALEEAHAKGIIHRDIKPANIMLTPKGQVKVLDFGLAKRVHQEMASEWTAASTESRTTPGVIMGTVEYMSPEQVLGQEVDRRTDLFSLE